MKRKMKSEKFDIIINNFVKHGPRFALNLLLFDIIYIFLLPLIGIFFEGFNTFIGGVILVVPLILFVLIGFLLLLISLFYKNDKCFDKNNVIKYKSYHIKIIDVENLLEFLNKRLSILKYNKKEVTKVSNGKLYYYTYKNNFLLFDFIIMFRIEEYSKIMGQDIDKKIENFLREIKLFYNIKTKLIAILIVNKKNDDFDDYVKSIYFCDKYKDILHVGVCLEEKKVYLVDNQDYFYKKRYKKMIKKVLDIFELKGK